MTKFTHLLSSILPFWDLDLRNTRKTSEKRCLCPLFLPWFHEWKENIFSRLVLPRDRKERFHTRRGIRMRLPVISSGTEDGKVKFSKVHSILALRLSIIVLTSCYARSIVFLTRWSYHIGEMSAQETRNQQLWKIRRTTLAFGVVQILLGLSLTTLSFTAFVFTSSERIRNACPYWAGFTVSYFIFPLTVFSNLRVVITSWRDFKRQSCRVCAIFQ